MTEEKIKEIITANSKISITFGSPKFLAIENNKLDDIAKAVLAYMDQYLCDAYRTGQKDGYDCGKIDSGRL